MFRYSDYDAAPSEPSLPSPDCTLIAPLLTAYFDLEAPGTDAMRVQQHLSNCARCAQMWRDWGDARAMLQTTPVPAPPHTLACEIVQMSRLSALLPSAPLARELSPTNWHDDVTVPPQLQDAILAVTTRVAAGANRGSITSAVVTQRDFSQTLRRVKSWTAMAAVPALALWLISLNASNSALLAPQDSASQVAISSTVPKPALSKAAQMQSPEPLIAQTQTAPTTSVAAASQRPIAPSAVEVASSQIKENANFQSSEVKTRPASVVTLAQWPSAETSVHVAPVTAVTAPVMTISLRSSQPLASSALSAVAPRATSAHSIVRTSTVSASPAAARARTAAMRTSALSGAASRRIAKLSTVSMTTPALSSAILTRPLIAVETPRVAIDMDTPAVQKATLPVVASRDASDEALWQSDVAPGRSALSVVQALNDNRPRELRDAFDAYTQTLMDDGDGPAATL